MFRDLVPRPVRDLIHGYLATDPRNGEPVLGRPAVSDVFVRLRGISDGGVEGEFLFGGGEQFKRSSS